MDTIDSHNNLRKDSSRADTFIDSMTFYYFMTRHVVDLLPSKEGRIISQSLLFLLEISLQRYYIIAGIFAIFQIDAMYVDYKYFYFDRR